MDFEDTPEEATFRQEVRHFLDAHALPKIRSMDSSLAPDVQTAREWQRKRASAGLGAICLPAEWGGRGLGPVFQAIYDQEESSYQVPPGRWFMVTMGMCLPTLLAFANQDWLGRLLPPAVRGDEIWCQLFSEPGAGSDLAAIRTFARQEGDQWIVNGQKVWTSGAHAASFGLLLVRTDSSVPKHRGLTAFFVDMHADGIDVRPIKQMTGRSHFNEVFFTDVVVPDTQRLGEPGQGWKVALHTLMNERLAVGRASEGPDTTDLARLSRELRSCDGDAPMRSLERIAELHTIAQGLKFAGLRFLTELSKGRTPGPEASIIKIASTQLAADVSSVASDLLGAAAGLGPEALTSNARAFQRAWLAAPGGRIGGGTEEILLNVLADRVLQLPPEVR